MLGSASVSSDASWQGGCEHEMRHANSRARLSSHVESLHPLGHGVLTGTGRCFCRRNLHEEELVLTAFLGRGSALVVAWL